MNRVTGSKMISMFICSFFVVQAVAQDLPDDQEIIRIYKEALKNTTACNTLPWDITTSININNGTPVVKVQAAFQQYMNDANIKNQVNNCITTVANSNENMFKQDKVKPTLAQKLRDAASKFVTYIELMTAKQQNVKIGPQLGTYGIRG